MEKALRLFPKNLALHWRWFLLFAGVAGILTISLSAYISELATAQLKRQIGENLTQLSSQLSDTLDRGLYERKRDIQVAASLISRYRLGDDQQAVRDLLNKLQETYSDYAWIGFVDPNGKVISATGKLLEGQSVVQRPWFQHAQTEPFVGDVHAALLLSKKLNGGKEPLRFLDVASPVRDHTDPSKLRGVIGAHLNWRWARDVEKSIAYLLRNEDDAHVYIIDGNNNIVLGPNDSEELEQLPEHLRQPLQQHNNKFGWFATSNGNNRQIVGYTRSEGFRSYEGLGWTVLVTESATAAYSEITELKQTILLISILVIIGVAAIGWFAAKYISLPLRQLTRATVALDDNNALELHGSYQQYPEVRVLSETLRSMVTRLGEQRTQLRQLNTELDSKVQQRTAELEQLNAKLSDEVAQRRAMQNEREKLIRQLEEQANTDPLTQLANRRRFFERAEQLLQRAERHGDNSAVLALDLDHFKRINDDYGHQMGDQVLQRFADVLRSAVRDTDLVARTGGEEFIVMLERPQTSSAEEVAERIRKSLAEQHFEEMGEVSVTVSIGAAIWQQKQSLDQLIKRADNALYEAKEKGRNTVCWAPDSVTD
ncbi:hypothetical protein CWI84_08270 [Idiomarina tyrosinivorans]|uniref:diguanylate cyclase n=1 Tax=Idiomarina tyrosinivorans TaxID=1445662 RepID=A0A432ZPT9_9GAMM|nr:sensor domain-containing diguanylate cyclase [Idiomarina tyrosinivorans]RUO79945.1 hypothetical protein CWI84_08270 [Idiomarina tyrosinivorans]